MNRLLASWVNVLGRRLASAINIPGTSRPFLNQGALIDNSGAFLTTSAGDHIAYAQANP